MDEDRARYLDIEQMVKRELRDAERVYVNGILKNDLESTTNYRPVSLTCITCKLFEHIICNHILAHLEDHKILTDLQHGFRSGRSCKTQLVTTFQNLAQMHNKKAVKLTLPF